MAKVAVTWRPDDAERQAVQNALGDVVWLAEQDDPRAAAADIEVVLVFWPVGELKALGLTWQDFPRLRLIQVATAGVNHIGWDRIPARVQVAATPGATGPDVAEHVLAFILEWTRDLRRSTERVRSGRFDMGGPVKAVRELRVGVVGFGGIGQEVARLLSGLGATVEAVSRSGTADEDALRHLDSLSTMSGLAEMVARSDVLVLCLPFVRSTQGLVDAEMLARFTGGDRLLVNVARGPIVVERALYDWLAADQDAHAAALDVWWDYPKGDGRPFSEPFHGLRNVTMTPHNSPNVAGFRATMVGAAAEQVAGYLETGEAAALQDREAYATGVRGDGRV